MQKNFNTTTMRLFRILLFIFSYSEIAIAEEVIYKDEVFDAPHELMQIVDREITNSRLLHANIYKGQTLAIYKIKSKDSLFVLDEGSVKSISLLVNSKRASPGKYNKVYRIPVYSGKLKKEHVGQINWSYSTIGYFYHFNKNDVVVFNISKWINGRLYSIEITKNANEDFSITKVSIKDKQK